MHTGGRLLHGRDRMVPGSAWPTPEHSGAADARRRETESEACPTADARIKLRRLYPSIP
jgi:hypothetical protein